MGIKPLNVNVMKNYSKSPWWVQVKFGLGLLLMACENMFKKQKGIEGHNL